MTDTPTMAQLLELARGPIGALRMRIALGELFDQNLTARAHRIAETAHAGQDDKSGTAYISHPHRVATRLTAQRAGEEAVALAWLHDVVEDTSLTLEDVAAAFPHMPDLIDALDAITHRPGEARTDYYDRVKASPLALTVKRADIADNTDPARTKFLDEPTRERLAAKYAKALAHLDGEDQ